MTQAHGASVSNCLAAAVFQSLLLSVGGVKHRSAAQLSVLARHGRRHEQRRFLRLRDEHLWKVFPLLVAPIALLVIVTAILPWVGAPPVPRWVFIGALAWRSVMVASTLLIQIPIQLELNRSGFERTLLDHLIWSDLLFRNLPSLAEGAFVLIGLWRVVASRSS